MSLSYRAINPSSAKQTRLFPVNFWNGVLFGSAIWTILFLGATLTDYALKLIV